MEKINVNFRKFGDFTNIKLECDPRKSLENIEQDLKKHGYDLALYFCVDEKGEFLEKDKSLIDSNIGNNDIINVISMFQSVVKN